MGLSLEGKCNSTLENIQIGDSEEAIINGLTFHQVITIIATLCAIIAILTSFYLIFMHAINYTKPYEQRHIIRILFMVPIYSSASLLSHVFYWNAVYFRLFSDCYEAFAIAAFFALMCHYIAPDLHEQKNYFRLIQPRDWIWPLNWFEYCCAGTWRTPRSGLTWFNIIWTGIYQYCFIRIAMTLVAVITQYFGRYCESSQSPLFAHIWVLVIEGAAVSIAMYCLVQFFVQLRHSLKHHQPFLKILAIKLVVFLSFWQSFTISILTSSAVDIVRPSSKVAYPDLKIGVSSLLLCIEMAIFSIFHLFAFPYKPYTQRSDGSISYPYSLDMKNDLGPKQGGLLGVKALIDAMNPLDLVKAFARALPWLFVGRKLRESDASYNMAHQKNDENSIKSQLSQTDSNSTQLMTPKSNSSANFSPRLPSLDRSTLKSKATYQYAGYIPARERYDENGDEISVIHEENHSHVTETLVFKEPSTLQLPDRAFTAHAPVLQPEMSLPLSIDENWATKKSAARKNGDG